MQRQGTSKSLVSRSKTEITLTTGFNEVEVQCTLEVEDWKDKYDNLSKCYDKLMLKYIFVKGELEAFKRLHGTYDSDQEVISDSTPRSSIVDGFSDRAEGGGVGTKVIFSGFPIPWTFADVENFFDGYDINFVGMMSGKAAVFFNHEDEALQAVEIFDKSLLRGSILELKLERSDEVINYEESDGYESS